MCSHINACFRCTHGAMEAYLKYMYKTKLHMYIYIYIYIHTNLHVHIYIHLYIHIHQDEQLVRNQLIMNTRAAFQSFINWQYR
jgi:hypothetical protein